MILTLITGIAHSQQYASISRQWTWIPGSALGFSTNRHSPMVSRSLKKSSRTALETRCWSTAKIMKVQNCQYNNFIPCRMQEFKSSHRHILNRVKERKKKTNWTKLIKWDTYTASSLAASWTPHTKWSLTRAWCRTSCNDHRTLSLCTISL